MPSSPLILETALDGLTRHSQGKVRDIYSFPDDPSVLLIVATDRISAFDYVLGSGIPDKGKVLTQLSAFWFGETSDIVSNHMRSTRVDDFPAAARAACRRAAGTLDARPKDRAVSDRVRRSRLFVRLGLEGISAERARSAASGCQPDCANPTGCRSRFSRRPPRRRPATTSTSAKTRPQRLVGRETIEKLRNLTLRLYSRGAAHAEHRGIIVADTKFEFGRVLDGPDKGEIILIDEALTPDSSRFWPRDIYSPGGPQPSFDKQFVRDYLESIRWNKQPPGPVASGTRSSRKRGKSTSRRSVCSAASSWNK